MCELLNQAFGKVFTKEDLSDIPEAKWEYSVNGGVGLCDIIIDDIRVMQILDKLREDKAAGADELVPRFLSKIKYQLARPLTILFNNIMKMGKLQLIGRKRMKYQYLRVDVEMLLLQPQTG